MTPKILLTSFDIWLPHHKTNSSDDLLLELAKFSSLPLALTFFRRLPVDIDLASHLVLTQIQELEPDGIICCGMAQKRTQLTLESNARLGDKVLQTSVNLDQLILGLGGTKISHDAGKFVCEGLYYLVLEYLRDRNLKTPCIFVHVPILTPENLPGIVSDFLWIVQRLHHF